MSVPRAIRWLLLPTLLACGGDSTTSPPVTSGTPSTPSTPTTPTTPTTPPSTATYTISITTVTSETNPAGANPTTGMGVKVVDAQGNPAKGVTLTWTANDGGSVLGTSATDTLGRAVALWILGPAAEPQKLTVSHAQATNSVVFTGYVPIGSVTAVAPPAPKYIGDTLSSYMVVKDTKGTVLTGPASVFVRDTTVTRPVANGGLVGLNDGSTYVIVVSGLLSTPVDSVKVDFYRQLHGQVWAYDDSPLPAMRAYSTNGGVTDSSDVSPTGQYAIRLSRHPTGWVSEVAVDFVDRSNRRFYPVLMPVAIDCVHAGVNCVGSDINASISFVLVPKQYTVKTGLYTGRTLNVDLGSAMVTSENTGPAYLNAGGKAQQALSVTGAAPRLQNTYFGVESEWLVDSLPVGVALHRACCSSRTIVADDSIQLWRALNIVQNTLGLKIWVPINDQANYTMDGITVPTSVNRKLIFQFDSTLPRSAAGGTFSLGLTPGVLNQQDFVMTGWRNSATDHVTETNAMSQVMLVEYKSSVQGSMDRQILVHEVMHGLGVGHGCQWASTQSYCGWNTDSLPSFEDAAYVLLGMDVKAAMWKHHALHGFTPALFGQRALVQGIDPIPSPWTLPEPASTGGADDIRRRPQRPPP